MAAVEGADNKDGGLVLREGNRDALGLELGQ